MMERTSAISVENFRGRHVKVFFNNGAACEGTAVEWSDSHAVLLSKDSDNVLYIYNPKENIMMVKIMVEALPESAPNPAEALYHERPGWAHAEAVDYKQEAGRQDNPHNPFPPWTSQYPAEDDLVEPPPPKLDHHEPDPDLRLKKLADLKKQQADAIKDRFQRRIRTFSPTHLPIGHYGTPSFKK